MQLHFTSFTMPETNVLLGGKEYSIKRLPVRKSRVWRAQFNAKLDTIIGDILELTNLKALDMGDLSAVVTAGKNAVIGLLDEALDLVCEYAPEIAQDRERIEEEAYDNEVVEAFERILGLAFPLGSLLKRLNLNGLTDSLTSKS